jgi:hypothetical protein
MAGAYALRQCVAALGALAAAADHPALASLTVRGRRLEPPGPGGGGAAAYASLPAPVKCVLALADALADAREPVAFRRDGGSDDGSDGGSDDEASTLRGLGADLFSLAALAEASREGDGGDDELCADPADPLAGVGLETLAARALRGLDRRLLALAAGEADRRQAAALASLFS